MNWFHVAEIEPGVHVVAEPGHVCCWLVAGTERTVLIDTGLGLLPIRPAVEPVAASALFTITSHSHFDHVGGNFEFDERLAYESAPPLLAAGTPRSTLEAYWDIGAGLRAEWKALLERDRREFFLVGPDELGRPWPPSGVDLDAWVIAPPEPTGLLRDGDVVDLGGRTLHVLHTPGHAPDHICLLDEVHGILFAQDQAYYGPHLVYDSDADLEDFARSTRRLADEVSSSVRIVYCAHCLRPSVPPRFLRELADAAEQVAAGEATLESSQGLFGEPVLAADYGHFSILIPPRQPA
jgi:glyoxylase-like metal-dependent hydrolase (beta-lactamase superfamily II)